MAAQRTGDDRGETLADGDQSSRLFIEFVSWIGQLASQLARGAPVVSIDEAGSFQGNSDHRFQCVIEERVGCVVLKIGHENRNRGMLDRYYTLLPAKVPGRCSYRHKQQERDRRNP